MDAPCRGTCDKGERVRLQLTRDGHKAPKDWTGPQEYSPKTRSRWAIRMGQFIVDADIWKRVTSNEMGDVNSPARKRRRQGARVASARDGEQGSSLQQPMQDEPIARPCTEAGPSTCPDGSQQVCDSNPQAMVPLRSTLTAAQARPATAALC